MNRSVLVADGDLTELELIATVLARDGFHVVRASDGQQAIAAFGAEQVELVVCAAELPELDGAAVCELVKRVKPETRFVLLHPAGNDVDTCAILLSRIGCDAVLPSPFRYDALKDVLAEWGFRSLNKASVVPMSFAVPAPDITELVAAPSVESLLPDLAPPIEVDPVAVEAPISVPIPIPVVFPTVVETPVLAEYAGDGPLETPARTVVDAIADEVPADAEATVAAFVAAETDGEKISGGDDTLAPVAAWMGGGIAEPGVVAEVERAVAEWTMRESIFELTEADSRPIIEAPLVAEPPALELKDSLYAEPAFPAALPPEPAVAPDPELAIPAAPCAEAALSPDPDTAPAPDPLLLDTPKASLQGLTISDSTTPASTADFLAPPPELSHSFEPSTPISDAEAALLSSLEIPRPTTEPTPFVDPLLGLSADPAIQGDWLTAPQADMVRRDGFAGLDFGNSLDSALDAALGDIPMARAEAEPAMADMTLVLPPAPVPPPEDTPDPAAVSLELAPPQALAITLPTLGAPPAIADKDITVDLGIGNEPPPTVAPEPLQPTPVSFGTLPGEETKLPPRPRQSPPPPPLESVVDPAQQGSGVRTGASVWAPSASAQAQPAAPRIEARGIAEAPPPRPVEPPAPPPEAVHTVAPPPPPVEALGESPSPPSSFRTEAFGGGPPPAPPAEALSEPPPPPSEALREPPAAPLAAIGQSSAKAYEPRTTLPPSVPPEGDLRSLPLPRLLFELYGGTYCGTLKLTRKGIERAIDVWNGFPVAATVKPAGDDDDLATLLREHGRITPEQYVDAKRRAPGREAQLLVAIGVIDERDLLDVMREQTELRLAGSFAWRDGHYKITPSREPPDSLALSEVHPVKVIWRGCCEHYDVGSLLAFFSTLRARYVVATEVFPIHYQTLGPFLRRIGIAPLLNGHTTFEQALRSDDTQALAIAQALYVLIVTDMVRAQSTPGAPVALPENIPQRRQTRPVDYRELSRACEEVARAYLGIRERDYFEVLELARSATDDDVNAAYERLAKPFKVENLLAGLPDDVVRRAREIDGLLRRARDTLVSPEERRRYVARIDAMPPPPPADALAS